MIAALESASGPCFGPSFTKFRDPEEEQETSDLKQVMCAIRDLRVWLCANPRTSLSDLFSSPVPDFSKVHEISACSQCLGGVEGRATGASFPPSQAWTEPERRRWPRSSCHPTETD